jgi:hypothetical protein
MGNFCTIVKEICAFVNLIKKDSGDATKDSLRQPVVGKFDFDLKLIVEHKQINDKQTINCRAFGSR